MGTLHFLYHEVRPEESRYSYVLTRKLFEAHCEFLAQIRRNKDTGLLEPVVTFDDGHASDALVAQPTLERHGLRAIFFITAGWTGVRPGYMNWTQLRQLQASGHQIGAHGLTHKLLTACSDQELQEELGGAKRRLEDGLGSAVEMMSLPGGRKNRRVLLACEEAGFRQVFTSEPRAERMGTHPRMVGRLNLVGGTPVSFLERVLDPTSGALQQVGRKAMVKGALQMLLGDRLYMQLWAIGNHQKTEPAEAGTS